MLAATGMGYQSCPMDGFDFDAVAKIINLPEDHAIAFMIAIGKGTKEPWPKPGQLALDERPEWGPVFREYIRYLAAQTGPLIRIG